MPEQPQVKPLFTPVEAHEHTGFDSKQIKMENLIPLPVLDSIPTGMAREGTFAVSSVGGTYRFHIFIGSAWRSTTLT